MSYIARKDLIFAGAIFHVTWKCHNETWFLEDDKLKQRYYDLLLKYKDRYGVEIYSYCFMNNHPHITGKTKTADGISQLMQAANSQLAKWINLQNKRKGQAIMDRFKSPTIQTDNDLLAVMMYVDLNPTRTVNRIQPNDYHWSSYRHYAYGERNELITRSPSYDTLGQTDGERQAEYRRMVAKIIEEEGLEPRNYSRTLYIGDPEWVKARYEESWELQREKRAAYLKRRARYFAQAHSPP